MNYTQSTVGQLVVERPARARVFEKFGIDYCCGGKRPLADICAEKGIDASQVLEQLSAADQQPAETHEDWSAASMTQLADHIVETHHAYLRQELPRLDELTRKVASKHGLQHPQMLQVREIFVNFKAELDSHMAKEELILFPICRHLDAQNGPVATHCGSVQNPIRVMVAEHDDAGAALEQFRQLTDNYTPPATACNGFRALLDSLRQLEADMHQHVHKENNILFPKAIEAERRMAQ